MAYKIGDIVHHCMGNGEVIATATDEPMYKVQFEEGGIR